MKIKVKDESLINDNLQMIVRVSSFINEKIDDIAVYGIDDIAVYGIDDYADLKSRILAVNQILTNSVADSIFILSTVNAIGRRFNHYRSTCCKRTIISRVYNIF